MENDDVFESLRKHFTLNDMFLLMEKLPEPVCILSSDNDGQPDQFIYVNEEGEKLLEIPSAELRSYTWEEVFGISKDTDLKKLEKQYNQKAYDYNESPLKKNLKGRALRVSLKDFRLSTGETYFVLTIIDATDYVETKEKLRVASTEFESLFKYNPNMVYTINMDGEFTNINESGLKLLGYTLEEIVGMHFEQVVVDEYLDQTFNHYAEVLKGNFQSYTIQIKDKQGNPYFVEVTAVPIIIDEKIRGVIGKAQDITARLDIEQKLRESEESHRAFFVYNVDPVITYDLEGRFLTFNKATEEILNARPEELIGVPFVSFIAEELQEETWRNFQKVISGVPVQYETALPKENGERIYLHISLIPAYINGKLKFIHCIGKDITFRKQHDETLRHMAYHDGLTELGNQRLFSEEVKLMIHENNDMELALWIVDIDRFKFINDHLGHDAGDQLLSTFSSRLQKVIGHHGRVYRNGGDEFAILTPHTDELHTKLLASRVISEISKPYDIEGFNTVLTASIGISFYPRHGVDSKEIVRAADHAMYHAKKHGRNAFQLYSSDIEGLAYSDLHMETLLHQALDNKEFVLFYQPQIDAQTGKLHGLEALMRWNSPELGMVSPNSFIPVAEETGVIVPIGEWAIEEACRQNVEWQKQGMTPIPISVNLSLRQFYQSNLVKRIKEILDSTGLDARFLMLEITETIAMQEDIAAEVLRELKSIGIKIAMDDFGTGYSSLRYLQNFSIDHIKIDKAFTDNLHTKEGRAIIATIIALGKNLDMLVVVEGVETPAQVHELKELGCDVFQGYYFSRPIPAVEIKKLLNLQ